MSQDATSGGDLRNTEVSFKHGREWDYELEQIIKVIEERNTKYVGLQFPEGLKRRGPVVADDLRQLCDDDVTFMLSGQPCYGTCDLDTYLMRRTDVSVHFGHSPMKESDKIIYVPLFSNVDPFPTMEDALDDIEGDEVGLVTTAQRVNRLGDMCDQLEERGYTIRTRKGGGRLTYERQVLGCNYASADIPADDVLYVGGGKFRPLGLTMKHPDKNVVVVDPVNNVVTTADTRKFMEQRYVLVHKAMDVEKWGIIFCTKIGQDHMEIVGKTLEDDENVYLIMTDEVTPDRLRNLDTDAFVDAGCPYITTDDDPRFHESMLTPQEYRIIIDNEPLDALELDMFHGTW